MGFLALLGFKKKTSAKQLRAMLPATHSPVDVSVKNGPRGSVFFENVGAKTFQTTTIDGMTTGQSVTFMYQNNTGKYKFSAAVSSVAAKQATFPLPGKIETIQKFTAARARSSMRVDTTVNIQWRFAPVGNVQSEWQRGVLSDISRTGASLTSEREIKVGNALELKIPLAAVGDPLLVRAEARRSEQLQTSKAKKFSCGLRFVLVAPEADKAILDFINRRQVDLRNRGLA